MKKEPYQIAISVVLVLVAMLGVILLALRGVHIDINYNYNGQVPASLAAVQQQAAQPAAAAETPQAAQQEAAPTAAPAQTEQPAAAETPTQSAAPASDTQEQPTQAATKQPTEAVQNGQMSKAEIVKLYNTSVNKVKKEATELTRNYKHLSVPEDLLELPAAIQGIGKTAIGTFVKGSDEPESWTSKEDMNIVFPVGNTDYSSKLTADMVESAACTDNGKTYTVQLKLYDDKITSPEKGQGYAGVFNTITASTITGVSIPTVTFNEVTVKGTDGAITCTIDKASKRVTEITFANTDHLDIDVKVVFSNLKAKLAMVSEENYSIKY